MRFPTPPERVRFLPSVLHTPRSSSRPGSRSLTPVTRVRAPLGALLDATVVSGRKHTALPALRTGFESRRSLFSGLLVARMVVCIHPSGVRFPGAPLRCSRTRLVARPGCLPGEAGSTPVEGAGRAPNTMKHGPSGRAGRHAALAHRAQPGRGRQVEALLAVAQRIRAPPCEGGGRRFESSRRDSTTGRLGRRRSDTAVERGSIPRSSISP